MSKYKARPHNLSLYDVSNSMIRFFHIASREISIAKQTVSRCFVSCNNYPASLSEGLFCFNQHGLWFPPHECGKVGLWSLNGTRGKN